MSSLPANLRKTLGDLHAVCSKISGMIGHYGVIEREHALIKEMRNLTYQYSRDLMKHEEKRANDKKRKVKAK